MHRAQLGSAAAFEQLVLAYGPVVHRFLVFRPPVLMPWLTGAAFVPLGFVLLRRNL